MHDYEIWWFAINCTLILGYICWLCESWQAISVGYQDSHIQWVSLREHQAIYIYHEKETRFIHIKMEDHWQNNGWILSCVV